MVVGSKYPKNVEFDFENKITGEHDWLCFQALWWCCGLGEQVTECNIPHYH